jgi:4-carboxymuconolactone decarboxylase
MENAMDRLRSIVVAASLAVSWAWGCTTPEAQTSNGDTALEQQTIGTYSGAPYLGELRNEVLYGDVWERPELSPRDRSLITVSVTQSLYETDQFRAQLGRALDNGVSAEEISEVITHLAFYSGWPKAVNASRTAAEVFLARGMPLPEVGPSAPPLEGPVEAARGGYLGAPYLGLLRNSVLYGDVWERPGLSPRDRSLITLASSQALEQADEFRGHIGRGLNNGLTPLEISELITHVAFYAGWPGAVMASRTVIDVFGERGVELPALRR